MFSPSEVNAHELPRGLGLAWHDSAPAALPIVLTNRGLIFAEGGGLALRCAEAYGATVAERPHLVAEAGGTGILVVTPLSVQWTDDRACTLESSEGIADDYYGGFAEAPDGMNLLVSTLAPDAVSRVLASADGGRSWTTRSENRTHEVFTELAMAPSDPQRVYASGTRVDREAQTLTELWASSTDGGAHFDVIDLVRDRSVLAVHPQNPAIVFATQPTDDLAPTYRLLRSEDSGASFVTVLDGLSSVSGPVATDGGSVLWIGVGRNGGLFRSTDGGIVFTRVYEALREVHCLHERQGKLWVCGNHAPNVDGVWSSSDGAQTFEQVLTFPEVSEPVACGADDSICNVPWHDWVVELLPPPMSDAGVADAGAVLPLPDAGSAGVDATAPDEPATPPHEKRGGGCQTRPGDGHGGWLALCIATALAIARRPRKA
jgi:hypothetical protein